ncbi:TPA: hypothetical protein GM646_25450 [Klebsiella pneumoniae]|nr:hypothetical protein [Klebsiella pneumoniae]
MLNRIKQRKGISMQKWKKYSISVIAIIAILYVLIEWPFKPVRLCQEVTDEQALQEVQADFKRLLPRYPSAQEKLGTLTPELTWDKVERGTDTADKTISVPFTASGTKGTINFTGIYTCDTGKIEYSSEP